MTEIRGVGGKARRGIWILSAVGIALAVVATVAIYQSISELARTSIEPLARISVSSTLLDFGVVDVDHPVKRHLILLNEGQSRAETRIEVDGGTYRIRPSVAVLEPGERVRIEITALPAAVGDLSARLQVLTMGEGTEPLLVALSGIARERDALSYQVADGSQEGHGQVPARKDPTAAGSVAGAAIELASPADEALAAEVTLAQAAATTSAQAGVTAGAIIVPVVGAAGAQQTQVAAAPSAGRNAEAEAELQPRTVSDRSIGRITLGSLDEERPDVSLTGEPGRTSRRISDAEGEEANPVPGSRRDRELPEDLPEDLEEDDPLTRDPIVTPTLTISSLSTLSLLGSKVQFYSHQVGVQGTDLGGPTMLSQPIQFPLVSLGLDESILINQVGLAAGAFDSLSGEVNLQMPIQAVDSQGDAAPMVLQLTTGTALARNESGIVVSLSGAPRRPQDGLVRLVGIGWVPPGYRNSAENQPIYVEILGTLTFGTSIQTSSISVYPPVTAKGAY